MNQAVLEKIYKSTGRHPAFSIDVGQNIIVDQKPFRNGHGRGSSPGCVEMAKILGCITGDDTIM